MLHGGGAVETARDDDRDLELVDELARERVVGDTRVALGGVAGVDAEPGDTTLNGEAVGQGNAVEVAGALS